MRIKFLNTYIDNLTISECMEEIEKLVNNGLYNYIVTPNVDHIVKLDKDKEFQTVYKYANLIVTDGMPLIWISKLLKNPIKEKISGSDLFPMVCDMCSKKGYSIFLLGAKEGMAQKAAENLTKRYQGLNIVGTYSPSFGFEDKSDEIELIIKIINDAKPDILAVGLGAPKQEKFIYKYKERLKVPVSMAIGATIDFEAGNIKRAPIWMQKVGFEWAYRLCKEPKRMFRRYIVDDTKIVKLVLREIKKSKSVN